MDHKNSIEEREREKKNRNSKCPYIGRKIAKYETLMAHGRLDGSNCGEKDDAERDLYQLDLLWNRSSHNRFLCNEYDDDHIQSLDSKATPNLAPVGEHLNAN